MSNLGSGVAGVVFSYFIETLVNYTHLLLRKKSQTDLYTSFPCLLPLLLQFSHSNLVNCDVSASCHIWKHTPQLLLLSLFKLTYVLTCVGHNQAFLERIHVSNPWISSILIRAGQRMHKHSLCLIKTNHGQNLRSEDTEELRHATCTRISPWFRPTLSSWKFWSKLKHFFRWNQPPWLRSLDQVTRIKQPLSPPRQKGQFIMYLVAVICIF